MVPKLLSNKVELDVYVSFSSFTVGMLTMSKGQAETGSETKLAQSTFLPESSVIQ